MSAVPSLAAIGSAEAGAWLATHWEIAAELRPLPGDRDRTFHASCPGGRELAVKVQRDGPALRAQQRILEHLAARAPDLPVPRVVPSRRGEGLAVVAAREALVMRVSTWLPGAPMAGVRPRRAGLRRSVGDLLARLDRALAGVPAAAAAGLPRDLPWDLARAAAVVAGDAACIADAEVRALVERAAAAFASTVVPRLQELGSQVIHNDANDHNVVVTAAEADSADTDARRAAGLLDFGDAVVGPRVFDLAIACAYALLGSADPVGAAADVAAGYDAAAAAAGVPLGDLELELLPCAIAARLAVSLGRSSRRRAEGGAEAYHAVSERPARAALARLAAVPGRLACARLRAACGRDPVPRAAAVVARLRTCGADAAPVLAAELLHGAVVCDLSVGSPDVDGPDVLAGAAAMAAHVESAAGAAGGRVAVGRYLEPRLAYTTDAFRAPVDDGERRRTVHLGVDLFAPAGTAVRAPFAGVVFGCADNAAPLDYGPTVILEHDLGGASLWTLFGHLAREEVAALRVGQPIARGEPFARVGDATVNGGWAPHLHFQLIVDPLDARADFPGVATPDEVDVWARLCPDPNLVLNIDGLEPAAATADLLARRRAVFGRNLSLAYRAPLHVVRGHRQFLYAADGTRFLDAVNNVPHVGHCHPHVVRAAHRQLAVLNTNTRYLHEEAVRYAERLRATLPEPLRVVYLVCSGSEANELALRLCRAATGRRGVVVLEGGYHGNTGTLIELSGYKFAGPGGEGPAPHVFPVPTPDPYRGVHGADGVAWAALVAGAVARAHAAGWPVGAFLCESLLGCGGQIVLPDGFLREAYAAVRAAGGVCVADEVQVGLGRVGERFWAFELQGVVPDVVTIGKPIGNGHPLAAVVTTPAIAAAFANGMEYFNTFGGNPVSAAVGNAVLDVLEEEGLQRNALVVGERLLGGLRALGRDHEVIGDARGRGLFAGLELVRSRATKEPAAATAAYVVERLRERGVLVSTDGPLHDVVKIKPPLVFTAADADLVLAELDVVLGEDAVRSAVRD